MLKPIESPAEREQIFNDLIETTMQVENIDRAQAEKRMNRLIESGILNQFDGPEDPFFRLTVCIFLSTPVE